MTTLDEVEARFRANLPVRALLMARLAQEETADPSLGDRAYAGAWREAHKLAGTAGSFGNDGVAEAARCLENLLKDGTKHQDADTAQAFADLDEAIRATTMPRRSHTDSVLTIGLAGVSRSTPHCMELLTNELIEVLPLSLTEARTMHGYSDLDAVIVDATELSKTGEIAGRAALDFIAALRASHEGSEVAVLLLVRDSSLETRIAAAHAGADLILSVPLSRAGLAEAIRMVTSKHLDRPVVLAIDDDPEALELIQSTMGAQFEVVTLSDPGQLLAAIQEHSPDALVLDYVMPGVNGQQLCASVRLSRENNQIPIIFLTNRSDQEARLAAFNAGCDDFVTKDRVKDELSSRVASRIQRTAGLRAAAETDSLTGLALRRVFIPALESRISEATRRDTPLALCILDIDSFKSINDAHGHRIGDRVLADLGALIQQRFRREDLRCRWGGEEFAIAFPGESAETVKSVLTALLSAFSKKVFSGKAGKFRVTFSAGVASLGRDGMTMDALMAVADERMYMAKDAGRAQVVSTGAWKVCALRAGK